MRAWCGIWLLIVICISISCVEYVPKPRGYFRIDLPQPAYKSLPELSLPYTFQISHLAEVELSPIGNPIGWININYPSMRVRLYCSYLPITPVTFEKTEIESRKMVVRQTKYPNQIMEQEYNNAEEKVYGSLFMLGEESASPIQFMLTDSVSHFFRGALYYDCIINADSLAPVTHYLKQDIVELIQSFKWNR